MKKYNNTWLESIVFFECGDNSWVCWTWEDIVQLAFQSTAASCPVGMLLHKSWCMRSHLSERYLRGERFRSHFCSTSRGRNGTLTGRSRIFHIFIPSPKIWTGLSRIICPFPDFEYTFSDRKIQTLQEGPPVSLTVDLVSFYALQQCCLKMSVVTLSLLQCYCQKRTFYVNNRVRAQ